jgi:hypothetical protein
MTDTNCGLQLADIFRGTDVVLIVTKELAALTPVKGTSTTADLYEDVKIMMMMMMMMMLCPYPNTDTSCSSDRRSTNYA